MASLKILIPTDFSEQADFAWLMVERMQEKIQTDIHFVHVSDMPGTVTISADGQIETCGEIDVNYVLEQKEIVQNKLESLGSMEESNISTHLLVGKVTDSIVDFIKANHFDLIVMGTKGAWGLKEKLSGSETQMVARRSGVPVLSIMCDRSREDLHNILLVHNFSEPANEDLQVLQQFIQAFQPKLHLLQICHENVETEREAIESNMKIFAELNHLANYECHLIQNADVEAGVVQFNELNNIDLVCIGTHGINSWFHSSAAEKLINHLYKPVITFHLK